MKMQSLALALAATVLSAPAEPFDQPLPLGERRMCAAHDRSIEGKVADSEHKDEQNYHCAAQRETFVGRRWRLVDPGTAFVAARVARRADNDLVERAAQVVLITAIPSLAPQPSAVPKLRRNPRYLRRIT